jgi:hypothetical protein
MSIAGTKVKSGLAPKQIQTNYFNKQHTFVKTILLVLVCVLPVTFFLKMESRAVSNVLQPEHEERTTPKKSLRTTFYHLQPMKFVSQMLGCVQDDGCTIQFLHYGKTGGSDLQTKFFGLTNSPVLKAYLPGGLLPSYFMEHVDEYCSSKFFGLEIASSFFWDKVVPMCMEYRKQKYQQNNTTTTPRSIVLSSYREPIERLLSHIHQLCNKNLHLRNNVTLEACTRCSYVDDVDYWNLLANSTNTLYHHMLQLTKPPNIENIDILMIDSHDITSFYQEMNAMLSQQKEGSSNVNSGNDNDYKVSSFKNIHESANAEVNHNCDFGIHSELIRQIKYSSNVYRRLTWGAVY